eukprot:m.216347 g.216347  ORF g.216347 m.216347 type:complete len:68 (-) comp46203_c0_seq1:16-219(-)
MLSLVWLADGTCLLATPTTQTNKQQSNHQTNNNLTTTVLTCTHHKHITHIHTHYTSHTHITAVSNLG